jgi:hypothetical protein
LWEKGADRKGGSVTAERVEAEEMGIYVNRGNDSFARARKSRIYVDKTGLIEYTNGVVDTEQCHICNSRPRRFGKSMTAGMLAAYYMKGCDSRELFEGLEIAGKPSFEEHLNQYDVIHLDMAYLLVQNKSAVDTVAFMQKCVIDELRVIYPGILTDEDQALPFALSKINDAAGARFVIIIDEWDAIFRECETDKQGQQEYVRLLRGLFKGEQSKDFVVLAYITGILPIKRYNSESALNNFREFTMLNPKGLSEYIGFTEEEVRSLCETYNMDFQETARWYDGYSFRKLKHVYNPNSVVNAMLDGEYDSYWSNTVSYGSLKEYICLNFEGLRDLVIQMFAGARCTVDINTFQNDMTSFKSRDDVLTALIHLGYLAYDADTREAYVPNEEVRAAFERAVRDTGWDPVVQAIRDSDSLLRATWNRDEDAVAEGIDKVHMGNTSILQYNNENALSCVITLAYYNAANEYTLIREMPSGKGYADIVFLPRRYSTKPALVVELKYDQSAESAVAQIKDRRYPEALREYQGNILLVGISYNKEDKKHECTIEEWDKG